MKNTLYDKQESLSADLYMVSGALSCLESLCTGTSLDTSQKTPATYEELSHLFWLLHEKTKMIDIGLTEVLTETREQSIVNISNKTRKNGK